jgi:cobyrinic acid a,c-diamide synthase
MPSVSASPRAFDPRFRAPPRANGLIIAAPRSGSGKTLLTLGLLAALKARGLAIAPAKTGPDYIDAAILARVAEAPAINLDPWAMTPNRLRRLATAHATGADLLLVEGVMGLFDAAADGRGSTADLAATLGLPVVLVVDADKQGQSVAALISGFVHFRADVEVAGIILNRVATTRHERMLADAIRPLDIPLLGAIPRRDTLHLPERHLGLVLPDEIAGFSAVVAAAAEIVETYVDLNRFLAASTPISTNGIMEQRAGLAPLGQRIAIARDDAFSFIYQHILDDWRAAGAEISYFSPLANEQASTNSDAVYLPGGYPELHGLKLTSADRFLASLHAARDRRALIYGECGGYMVLGEELTDKAGIPYKMAGLLPVKTDISRPKRTLGYRRLRHQSPLPWPSDLLGHEFHYSSASSGTPLFEVADARGDSLPPMGAVVGRVMGSYAHVIDVATQPDAD